MIYERELGRLKSLAHDISRTKPQEWTAAPEALSMADFPDTYVAISVYLFLNKMVLEDKTLSSFYLSSKYSLLDFHGRDSKFEKEDKKQR